MKHTSGPFETKDWGDPNDIDIIKDNQTIGVVYCPPHVEEKHVPENRAECEANARLFAAAPELLAALIDQVRYMCAIGEEPSELALYAISKATGE